MITLSEIKAHIIQAKEHLSPDSLWIILGPTASGKTRTAVELAKAFDGEIISADSRQVYRHMDIGTGKDLEEYDQIPHHLINIAEPGERYQVDRFRDDFFAAYDSIIARGKQAVLCGGTGSYIQTILQQSIYTQIPKDPAVQAELSLFSKEQLELKIRENGIPTDFTIDFNSHKRLVRALEILRYIQIHKPDLEPLRTIEKYHVIGINPNVENRRAAIKNRLIKRLGHGLIGEVQGLLDDGLSFADLHYYGLEYRYVGLYLQGELTYEGFVEKLTTEINRYAKRQMTYFRKMEKDGIKINWF